MKIDLEGVLQMLFGSGGSFGYFFCLGFYIVVACVTIYCNEKRIIVDEIFSLFGGYS